MGIVMETEMQRRNRKKIWEILAKVSDPEIPVLSVLDLGMVRAVEEKEEGIVVTITPTYSGCPAVDVISMNIRLALVQNGFASVKILHQLSPAWTTDWMSEEGKNKLRSYGIAPPVFTSFNQKSLETKTIECPLCHSKNTTLISEFGSTACKALFQCKDCREPFDYFKCH